MSTESEKRLLRCCFTGHRPGKLYMSEMHVKHALAAAIDSAYEDGYRTFITGMAQGVDIWAGELVLEFKGIHPDIHIICALPHPDFEKRWSKDWQQRYNAILSQADLIKTVCDIMDIRPAGYEELTNFFVGSKKKQQVRFKSFAAISTAAINIIQRATMMTMTAKKPQSP